MSKIDLKAILLDGSCRKSNLVSYISTMIFKSIYTLIVLLHLTFLPRFLFSQELHGHPSISVSELIGIKNLQEFGQYMFAETDFEYGCGETEYGNLLFFHSFYNGTSAVEAYEGDGSFHMSIYTCSKVFYDFLFGQLTSSCDFVETYWDDKMRVNRIVYSCNDIYNYIDCWETDFGCIDEWGERCSNFSTSDPKYYIGFQSK